MNGHEITIGVDIGGTNTVVGAVDKIGNRLLEVSFPTKAHESAETFVPRLARTIEELCEKLPEYKLRDIGIAAPAANYREGTIESPANFKWGRINLVEMMKRFFTLPIAITNDSNAAALGELRFGLAKGMKNFIAITLGTGLGAGIIVDGRLLHGENGSAGELGHSILEPGGRQCGCGRRGCAETYVSATGICRTVFDLLAQRMEASELRQVSFNNLTAERIFQFATQGDPIANEAFEVTGRYLGRMLADAIAAFDPEAVILFGGLMNAGDMLLGPTRKAFEENALAVYKGKVKILKSILNNGQAAILGASCLVRETTDIASHQEQSILSEEGHAFGTSQQEI